MLLIYIIIVAIITWLFTLKKKDTNIYPVILESYWNTRDVPSYIKTGWGNGYAVIHKSHPLFGKDYNDIDHIDIHGGLTYAESLNGDNQRYKVIADEGVYIRTPKDYWVFGFDTAHYMDDLESCPKEYVQMETQNLVNQLKR